MIVEKKLIKHFSLFFFYFLFNYLPSFIGRTVKEEKWQLILCIMLIKYISIIYWIFQLYTYNVSTLKL